MSFKFLTNVRAVIFDLGNTLTIPDWERINHIVQQICTIASCEISLQKQISEILLAADANREFLNNLAAKSVRTNWHFLTLYKNAGLSETDYAKLIAALDKSHNERHLWTKINENALEVLVNLKNEGFFLGVISNSEDGRVKDVLQATEILPLLDLYLDSYIFGFAKPDSRIFLKALEKLKIRHEQAVYIGDSYKQDYIGAKTTGIKSILFDPLNLHSEKNVLKIRSLLEILD